MICQHTFTAIDFESAGTSVGGTDTPVQVATATWSPDPCNQVDVYDSKPSLTLPSDTWMSYIHTDKKITWAAQQVHGITSDKLKDAPKLILLWPDLKRRLANKVVVAHGHGTEKRFLRVFPNHGFKPWVDTLHLTRAAYPTLDSYSLGDVCNEIKLTNEVDEIAQIASPENTISWHDALYDSIASIVLLRHIINTFSLTHSPLSLLTQPNTSAWRQNNTDSQL